MFLGPLCDWIKHYIVQSRKMLILPGKVDRLILSNTGIEMSLLWVEAQRSCLLSCILFLNKTTGAKRRLNAVAEWPPPLWNI